VKHCLLKKSPKNEEELLARCLEFEGMSFSQLAAYLKLKIPNMQNQRKGWVGMAIEKALGTTAGTKSIPDFNHLGVELKTIPIDAQGEPAETTFVTSIALLTIHQEEWLTSQCYSKLKRVLWIPIESDDSIDYGNRRIGQAILWSPNEEQSSILKADWDELTTMICTGQLEEISASIGEYLQIRPKAANSASLCFAFDQDGSKILTLPRGFYLRKTLTSKIIQKRYA